MMLSLDVEFLTGVCVSTRWGTRGDVEFPPHPSRVFRAMVSAWADGGAHDAEKEALAAFERLGAPEVLAPRVHDGYVRTGMDTVYVPPNDASVSGKPGAPIPSAAKIKEFLYALPAYRTNRQARAFPSMTLPDDARTVRYIWPDALLSAATVKALLDISRRVSYIGHSHTLTRVHVHASPEQPSSDVVRLVPAARSEGCHMGVATHGELARLEAAYAAHLRPGAAAWQAYAESAPPASPSSSVFGGEWIVLASTDASAPALTAMPYVADLLRRTLIARADALPTGPHFPSELKRAVLELISGHAADGSPLTRPHVAVVPLAHLGNQHADGRVMGIAIVPPALAASSERDLLLDVLRAATGTDTLRLLLGRFGEWSVREWTGLPVRRSLDSDRYNATARVWSTATPLVLDRYPKRDGDAEAIVSDACGHVGCGTPSRVVLHKHCAFTGGEPARPRTNAPRWSGWARRWSQGGVVTDAFAGRPMTHATIAFDVPVTGPLIVGAGRYLGLGLCLPLAAERSA
jgi:CRISPR-associated protein Csb2